MFCPNCGKQTPNAEAKFCASCGAPLPTGDGGAAPAASYAPPPGAAAPSGYHPGPMSGPVPERRGFLGWLVGLRLWQKILLGIVVFVVLVVALAMWATSGLDEPVKRHFAALRSGDVVAAYSELSVAARQATSLDDFKKMVAGAPALTHVTGTSFSTREVTNGVGHLAGNLELDNGGKYPIEIQLVKENGNWKILAYRQQSALSSPSSSP